MTWQSSPRYPDPAIRVLDPSFARYHIALSAVERLFHGTRWGEGPVWFGDQRCLLWSDIPNDRILRWDEESGGVTVFRKPARNANGHTRDREGRLISCEHLSRSVTRTEHDGRITEIATHYEGRRLNSPNDVVVRSDGSIWFTDPPFGILGYYEGERAESETPPAVYRIDPHNGALARVAEGIPGPNGLAFSPDETLLYVVASRAEPREFWAYPVLGDRLGEPRVFIRCAAGETPDGFRVDTDGNLWCGWGMGSDQHDGVRVFNSAGVPIGHIALPERCANVAFGGRHRNRLFMAASQGLYALYTHAQGCPYPG